MVIELKNKAQFGWSDYFESQLSPDEFSQSICARVMAVHRGQIEVASPSFEAQIASYIDGAKSEEEYATVGDWVLIDKETGLPTRVLTRKSLFKRRAAGKDNRVQLIAANVDTVFIMTACNGDFNLARLERYLVLAHEAGATPVIVLTKIDLVADISLMIDEARSLEAGIAIITINSKKLDDVTPLLQWCTVGQTVALLGSSGVGKSTLVNTLSGTNDVFTQGNRRGDSKGRHTTTHRALHLLHTGAWLIDTPGMRELQLTDAAEGVEDVFADIEALALACRFGDCAHDSEPGCEIKRGLKAGFIDDIRLARWQKLKAEDMLNSITSGEKQRGGKAFGKKIQSAISAKKRLLK